MTQVNLRRSQLEMSSSNKEFIYIGNGIFRRSKITGLVLNSDATPPSFTVYFDGNSYTTECEKIPCEFDDYYYNKDVLRKDYNEVVQELLDE